MNKILLIYCDGGLANRINSLLSGLVLTRLAGAQPLVLWPRNNRCDVAFEDIFIPNHLALQTSLPALVSFDRNLTLWLHENDYGFSGELVAMRGMTDLAQFYQALARSGPSVLFSENSVLPWLPDALVQAALLELRFRPEIVQRALSIIARESRAGYFGIHLRATDFTSPPPVTEMFALVQTNRDKRFFVCSDNPELEQKFSREPNVFIHEKSAYVEKRDEGGWRGAYLDSDGLPYTSNINRTSDSVLQAAVDLLLLTGSTTIKTSASSFLALAERMRQAGYLVSLIPRSS